MTSQLENNLNRKLCNNSVVCGHRFSIKSNNLPPLKKTGSPSHPNHRQSPNNKKMGSIIRTKSNDHTRLATRNIVKLKEKQNNFKVNQHTQKI